MGCYRLNDKEGSQYNKKMQSTELESGEEKRKQ